MFVLLFRAVRTWPTLGGVTRLNSPRDNASLGDFRKLRSIISCDLRRFKAICVVIDVNV
jgi:hypothetical protein